VITGQCNVCDIRKKVFTNFHNTVTDRLVDIFFVYASFNSLFIFSLFSFFFARLISAVGDWMSTILRHMVWS